MTVLVIGATGEMGGRVCRLLRRWSPRAQVVGANRGGRAYSALPVRRLDVFDGTTLDAALEGVSLVVNAVGPYCYDPGPILRSCVRAHAHYVDLGDDADYLAKVARAAREAGAEAAAVAVIPGCSTVPGLASLLASRWARRSDVSEVAVFLSMGTASPPSRGLLSGLLRPLGRRAADGRRWFTEIVATQFADGRRIKFGTWPAPWPGALLTLGDRGVPVRFYVGFDQSPFVTVLRLAAPLVGRMPRHLIPSLAAFFLPLARAATLLGTPRGALVVWAADRDGNELARVEVHAQSNGLDVAAAPAVWVVQRILEREVGQGGVFGLEEIVAPGDALRWLHDAGYEVREYDDVGL